LLHILLVIIRWGALAFGVFFILGLWGSSPEDRKKDGATLLTLAAISFAIFWFLPKVGFYQGNQSISDAEYSPNGKKPYYIHFDHSINGYPVDALTLDDRSDDFNVYLRFTQSGDTLDVNDDDVAQYWKSSISDIHFKLSDHNTKIREIDYFTDGSAPHIRRGLSSDYQLESGVWIRVISDSYLLYGKGRLEKC